MMIENDDFHILKLRIRVKQIKNIKLFEKLQKSVKTATKFPTKLEPLLNKKQKLKSVKIHLY